ncbi:MAG: hypothetical protein [Olavius algarvensis Delta 4 endosymbiont]|nr:MAG: hypothetical protein [Olavius algarvensis Delta 4 endosymbiont]
MEVVVYLLGCGMIAYCSYLNLYTRQAVNALKSLFQNYQLKYLSIIPAIVAVLFLMSTPVVKCPWPFWIVGILAAIEAIVAFINPRKIYSRMLDWLFENVSYQAYRMVGIVGIIFGTLLLTLVK